LLLYVEEKITNNGGDRHINMTGEGSLRPEVLTLYYAGKDPFWDTEFRMTGNVVASEADIMIAHSAILNGNVFTNGDVEISGAADISERLIYAPDGRVKLSASAVTGAVIAHEFLADGDSRIYFPNDRAFLKTLPQSIFSSGSDEETGGSGYRRLIWSLGH